MTRIQRNALLILAATILLVLALQAQTGISDVWVRFADGTVQTTAAHNCHNPADRFDVMIRVGGVCIDKYEASVWSSPTGGTQYGLTSDDYPCSKNGQDCFRKIYARSVAGVQPSRFITWFQAEAALSNSGKRLPHNSEWQKAVQGTPEDTNCNVDTFSISNTGAFANCVSAWGHHDMVGNLWEWVADWVSYSTACPGWGSFSDDVMCLSLTSTAVSWPGALTRGGFFANGTAAGPLAVDGNVRPSVGVNGIGFRGAR